MQRSRGEGEKGNILKHFLQGSSFGRAECASLAFEFTRAVMARAVATPSATCVPNRKKRVAAPMGAMVIVSSVSIELGGHARPGCGRRRRHGVCSHASGWHGRGCGGGVAVRRQAVMAAS
eukprot:6177043-Pleurochrysis_carterae.AAC.2